MTFIEVVAVLDANVLYSALVRDILLRLADAGFFQPKWSKKIEKEWTRNLLANRPDIGEPVLARTVAEMNRAFPDATVVNYVGLMKNLQLPDLDDRHVLAAAIKGHATHIVTANTKDFPRSYVASLGIQVNTPDDFLTHLISTDSDISRLTFDAMVSKFRNPPVARKEVLAMLARCGLPNSARLLV